MKNENNIADLLSIPKTSKKLPYVLSIKEIKSLMSLPDLSTYSGVRDRCILELFYSTGVRISEIIKVKMTDLYIEKKL